MVRSPSAVELPSALSSSAGAGGLSSGVCTGMEKVLGAAEVVRPRLGAGGGGERGYHRASSCRRGCRSAAKMTALAGVGLCRATVIFVRRRSQPSRSVGGQKLG